MKRASLVLLFVALLAGCLEEDGGNPPPPPPPAPNLSVEGGWSLSGRGQRERCNDGLFDGRFELSALPLEVLQTPSGTGADTLLLTDPDAFAPLVFSGTVSEDRVNFNAVEPIGDGQQQSFRFSGTVAGTIITGSIQGSGPAGCEVVGVFEVAITPPPRPDAGPTDGGPTDGGPSDGGDPMMGDPTPGDPVMGDPAMGDPAVGDPAMGDPAPGDPALGDPTMPAGDPTSPGGDEDEDRRPTIVTKALESCSSTQSPISWLWLLFAPLLAHRRRMTGLSRQNGVRK